MVGCRCLGVGSAGFGRPADRWRGMKTTSPRGGRKAHTARERRVRYETSTRVISWWAGPIRIVLTLWHGPGGPDKHVGGRSPGARAGGGSGWAQGRLPGPGAVIPVDHREVAHLGDIHGEEVELALGAPPDPSLEGTAVPFSLLEPVHGHRPPVDLHVPLGTPLVVHDAV